MKFLIVLAIIALVAPIYAQDAEEKTLEKRGIYGLHSGGLGLGGHGGGYSSYSAPILRVSSGHGGGYGSGIGLHGIGRIGHGHGY
nr:PREDICTED: glycine-rich RNA-binding protein blt801-like [Megachile rotundata]